MRLKIVCCMALMAFSSVLVACAGPPTSSRLQIGADYAELPKNDSFESAKYEYTNAATGEHRVLEIKNAHADPSAALKAFTDVQTSNLRVLESAVNKIAIPGVVAPTTPAPSASPATGPPK